MTDSTVFLIIRPVINTSGDIIASSDISSTGRLNLTLQISTERWSVVPLVAMKILTHSKFSSSSNVMFRNSVERRVLSYSVYARHLMPYTLHMTHKEFYWKYLFRQRNHIYLRFQSTNMFKQGKKSQFSALVSGLVKKTSSFQGRGLDEVSKCSRTAWIMFRCSV